MVTNNLPDYPDLTDAQVTELLATRVLGLRPYKRKSGGVTEWFEPDAETRGLTGIIRFVDGDFRPLDDDTDLWRCVDARHDELVFTIDNYDFDNWRVHIFKSPDEGWNAEHPDPRHALAWALLRAEGVVR